MKIKLKNNNHDSLINHGTLVVNVTHKIEVTDNFLIERYLYNFYPLVIKIIIDPYWGKREEVIKDIQKVVDDYNENVWLTPLKNTLSKDFIGKGCVFFAANTNYREGFLFCPGFNTETGDTFDTVYQKHICKMIIQDNFMGKIKKFLSKFNIFNLFR